MDYSFFDFLTLVGALGMFLYGMKTMSEGLQKVAGNKLRNILSVMTTNRVMGVFTGLLITAIIQSSSATTVMVVSFVNAGLLSLAQAIGVIMGANVGTTVTAWIISLFGFKVDISAFSLPLIAFALPMLFAKKNSWKSWGEFIMGFALLFLGLYYLKTSVPDLQSNPQALSFIRNYTSMGFGSVLIFLIIGTVLTIIVQSSSATVAITLIMCTQGWIPFEMAVAMILGENIGTTITANLAALSANAAAKRAAIAHLMFNIFGVCWCILLFYPFTRMISWIITHLGLGDPHELNQFIQTLDTSTVTHITSGESLVDERLIALRQQLLTLQISVSYGLSLFHTMFNLCNICIMIWFVKLYVRICNVLIPGQSKTEGEFHHLKHISTGILSTSELSLMQARKELAVFGDRVIRMNRMAKELLYEQDEDKFLQLFNRITKYEEISDRMDLEIADYLTKVMEGRLSAEGKENIRIMLRADSEIESIADSCFNIARTIKRRNEAKAVFTDEQIQHIEHMFGLVDEALAHMYHILTKPHIMPDDSAFSYNKEHEINLYRDLLKNKSIENIDGKAYKYSDAVYYMDIVTECEKLGDYVLNVIQAIVEKKFNTY
ncbi:MAG: Na/Pi cotransporter family protein [Tannerella sp.]|jgi:phosphate:Na+ symporter|nr:Na/Pi cotransporter family protein [Tannerella sp.]